jgi:hypothetical protein
VVLYLKRQIAVFPQSSRKKGMIAYAVGVRLRIAADMTVPGITMPSETRSYVRGAIGPKLIYGS